MRRKRGTAPRGTHREKRSDNGCAEPPVRLIMAAMALGMIVGALISPAADSGEQDAAVVEISLEAATG